MRLQELVRRKLVQATYMRSISGRAKSRCAGHLLNLKSNFNLDSILHRAKGVRVRATESFPSFSSFPPQKGFLPSFSMPGNFCSLFFRNNSAFTISRQQLNGNLRRCCETRFGDWVGELKMSRPLDFHASKGRKNDYWRPWIRAQPINYSPIVVLCVQLRTKHADWRALEIKLHWWPFGPPEGS